MDKKELKSRIRDIMNHYFIINDLTPKYHINDTNLIEELEKHVKEILVTHDSYKEEIPNLKVIIIEILNELSE